MTHEQIAKGRCKRCVGFGEIAYFGDSQVTCPSCGGTGRAILEKQDEN